MFDKELIKTFTWGDIEGKTLVMHYTYEDGHYYLVGHDVEENKLYVLAVQ